MGLKNLLDHTCDIYHYREGQETPGWGLLSAPSFRYPDEPDISGQECHFGVKLHNATITQTAPANLMDAKIKLTLPVGTDIRINDKIVDCKSGFEYTAEKPVNVRDHHIFVYIKREGGQRAL